MDASRLSLDIALNSNQIVNINLISYQSRAYIPRSKQKNKIFVTNRKYESES